MDASKIHLLNQGQKEERNLKNEICHKVFPQIKCTLDSQVESLLRRQESVKREYGTKLKTLDEMNQKNLFLKESLKADLKLVEQNIIDQYRERSL